jgi:hypothetical protein
VSLLRTRLTARTPWGVPAMQPTMAAALDVSRAAAARGVKRWVALRHRVTAGRRREPAPQQPPPAAAAPPAGPSPPPPPPPPPYPQILPPEGYPYTPASSLLAKFAHNSQNRVRCSVNVVAWQPDGRRCISGAQTGEITLWRGENFTYESVLQVGRGRGRARRV